MHRIDTSTATGDNKFTNGNPQTATPATVISDAWLNAVQEEIATVITGAGIALNKPDNAQLLAAIRALGTPVGVVESYAGSTAPTGWLLCAGQVVNRVTYAALFAVIGTTYGAGDGSTTFGLPDLRGRTIAGKDDMGGTAASRLTNTGVGNPGVNGTTLGATGGVDRHTLSSAQMPAHSHPTYAQSNGAITNSGGTTYVTSSGNSNTTLTTVTQITGSTEAHPNVQPTIVLNYIIKT
jgi:microcystin-dependent protein